MGWNPVRPKGLGPVFIDRYYKSGAKGFVIDMMSLIVSILCWF